MKRPALAWLTCVLALLPLLARAEDDGGILDCGEAAKRSEKALIDFDCEPQPEPNTDLVPAIASLKTPHSPAFMALGLSPSEIERPTSPTGLATSLANGLSGDGRIGLGEDIAIAFNPYWLVPRTAVSFEDLVAQPSKTFYRDLSFSLANAVKGAETDGGIDTSSVAVGLSTTLWPGKPSREAQACESWVREYLHKRRATFDHAWREHMAQWKDENPKPTPKTSLAPDFNDRKYYDQNEAGESIFNEIRFNDDVVAWQRKTQADNYVFSAWTRAYDAELQAFEDDYNDDVKSSPTLTGCLRDIHGREGIMVSAAVAWTATVPGNDWKKRNKDSRIDWLTVGYVKQYRDKEGRRGTIDLSVLGVYRQQNEDLRGIGMAKLRDFGGRLALAWRKMGIAPEVVRRRQTTPQINGDGEEVENKDTLYRVALGIDYHLSSGMWLNIVAGKDFGDGTDTPLLVLANLQWNFGLDRGVKLDTETKQGASQ